ncbi:MAG: pilus assembly protein [Chloroflexi bacterium]|nr:pilus assembly protein [Chloroflexota bacterium]
MPSNSGLRASVRVRPPRGRRRRTERQSCHPGRDGQALVEFALIVPIMLFLLVIAIDFGRLFFSYIQINNASREGAAAGIVAPQDTAAITAAAFRDTNVQGQGGENSIVVTATCADPAGTTIACTAAQGGSGTGNTVTVNVRESFSFLTPFIGGFFGGTLPMNASTTATVLGLAANGGSSPPSPCDPPTAASFVYSVSGLTVTVDASASRPDAGQCAIASYDWAMGDPANPDPFPPIVGKTASYSYAAPGTYTIRLTVSNPGGQLDAPAQTVTIGVSPTPTPTPSPTPSPTPTPTPSPTPTPVCAMVPGFTFTQSGKSFNFFGSYTGQPAPLTWSWAFGDNATVTGQNVAHTYGSSSSKTVTLTVTNGSCSASTSQTVKP